MRVAALGKATLEGLAMGGVVGVVKHIPGHGRAASDSHVELPVVTAGIDELAIDFEPFAKPKDAPMVMPAHVTYTASAPARRSEEHTSELQSLMRTSDAVVCLKTKEASAPKNSKSPAFQPARPT